MMTKTSINKDIDLKEIIDENEMEDFYKKSEKQINEATNKYAQSCIDEEYGFPLGIGQ